MQYILQHRYISIGTILSINVYLKLSPAYTRRHLGWVTKTIVHRASGATWKYTFGNR